MRVTTSNTDGIRFLLQTTETQVIAVDTFSTVRFYNFVDKKVKEEEENKKKEEEKFHQLQREVFQKYDVDKSGRLERPEVKKFVEDVINTHFGLNISLTDEQTDAIFA